jgi:hypothetical protein
MEPVAHNVDSALEHNSAVSVALLNVKRYDQRLNDLEIAPNGDDYNEILRLLAGGVYEPPVTTGR